MKTFCLANINLSFDYIMLTIETFCLTKTSQYNRAESLCVTNFEVSEYKYKERSLGTSTSVQR